MLVITRSYLLMNIPEEGENKLTDAKLQGYAAVLSIGSTRCKANLLGVWKVYSRVKQYFTISQHFGSFTVLTWIFLNSQVIVSCKTCHRLCRLYVRLGIASTPMNSLTLAHGYVNTVVAYCSLELYKWGLLTIYLFLFFLTVGS